MPFIIAFGLGGATVYHAATVCDLFERGCRVGMSFLALLIYNWKQAAVGIGVIALGWLLMKGWHAQAKAYSAAKRQWQRTWFCHTCGQAHQRG